ncbi:MAG: hypothetical protein F4Y49_03480 [Dehalococcoidia bacterium]|nr:hypothetical protein [Dehalococcoidia bacterium]
MNYLLQDVDSNSNRFADSFPIEIAEACDTRLENRGVFRDSYRRVVSLQAWRTRFFEESVSDGVSALFLEAQNDALLSVVLAHMSMWRPALQSLRSCIENVLNTCYYADHPVEFQLWEIGEHRSDFSELMSYFMRHPNMFTRAGFPDIVAHIRQEYATLSKAVHASSVSFHMTSGGNIVITDSDNAKYNQWNSRHRNTLLWLNFLLVTIYAEKIKGPRHSDIRSSISLAISDNHHSTIAENLNVHLFPIE